MSTDPRASPDVGRTPPGAARLSFLHEPLGAWALFVCLLLPWLNPWVPGPSRYIGPWLIAAFCGVFIVFLRRHLSVQRVLAAWWAAAAASAAIALLQYAGLSAVADPWINQIGPGEAFGNLRQRNQLATLTSIGLVALLAWVGERGKARQGPQPLPPWAWMVVSLLAAGNAASGSRTGLLAWALVALMLVWWQRGRSEPGLSPAAKALLVYLGGALLLSWHLADGGLFQRLSQAGADSRRELWANVLTLIAQKPGGGWGWGELAYAHFITVFSGSRFPMLMGNAHNLPLHVAVELGIPAALLIGGALVWAVRRGRPWSETDTSRQAAWAVLAVIGLHSLLEFPLWFGPFQITVVLCTGYLWATRTSSRPAHSLVWPNLARGRLFDAAALGALTLLVAASMDYHAVSQRYLPADQRSALQAGPGGWLFQRQAQFATLATTALTADNAAALHALALEVLHYSPEPVVVEALLKSADLLGLQDEVQFYAERYRLAYPDQHRAWLASSAR